MPTTKKRLYAEISKTEKQDDGTLKVWGYASTEAEDSDGEVITADAMKAARAGYMAFGAVREMHDPKKAAGTAIDYDVQDDGKTFFGALVVDPIAVKKVETQVYKGFSIGARVPKGGRDGKTIKSIDLVEVSLVDRPANEEAVFTLFKAEGADTPEPDDATSEGGETDASKAAKAGEVQKGMWTAKTLLDALMLIRSAMCDADWETQTGLHTEEIVAELKATVTALGATAQKYLGEELANMVKAAGGGEMQKAGAKFSAATKGALKAAHDACKAADKALADLGYDKEPDEDDDGKKAAADALQKATVKPPDDAEATEVAELLKAAGVTGDSPLAILKAMGARITEQGAEIERMKALPAPPKGYLNAQAVTKAEDRGEKADGVTPIQKADGDVNEVATLIKAAQAKPIRIT